MSQTHPKQLFRLACLFALTALMLAGVLFPCATAFAAEAKADAKKVDHPKAIKAPKGTPKKKLVYLTFDDGPSKNTKPLLKVLKKHKVQATFFVIGQNKKYLPVIKNEYQEGHTVALHSWTHNYKKIYKSKKAYLADLAKISKEVEKRTGEESKYVRFPGGGSNTVSRHYKKGIMTALAKDLKKKDYRYYDWNVSSEDAAGKVLSSKKMADNVIKGIKSCAKNKKSSVVLMHDSSANKNLPGAVDRIIKWGKKNGYYFIRLDDKTPQVHHKIAN